MCIFCERAKAQANDSPSFGFEDNEKYEINFESRNASSISIVQRKEAEQCEKLRQQRTPCTIITGFLGAGKTTLINHILKNQEDMKISVIENEFGEVSVDDALLQGSLVQQDENQKVILMPNGCMCCRVRGDLVEALRSLVSFTDEHQSRIDCIILEMSGLSEVAPVVQTFFSDDFIQQHIKLDAVVGVCDSVLLHQKCGLADNRLVEAQEIELTELISEQLMLSDRILLNKVDLVSKDDLPKLTNFIQKINPNASIIPSIRGEVDLSQILSTDIFSLNRALEIDVYFSELMNESSGPEDAQQTGSKDSPSHHQHHHTRLGFRNVGIEITSGPLNWQAFQDFLVKLIKEYESSLCRFKGVLWVAPLWHGGQERRALIQGLYGHFEKELGAYTSSEARKSRLVFIGTFDERFEETVETEIYKCLHDYVTIQKNTRIDKSPQSMPREEKRKDSFSKISTQNLQNPTFASRLGGLKFGGGAEDFGEMYP